MKLHIPLLILTLALSFSASAQRLWTIGPMVHFSLGDDRRTSFGVEVAYWTGASNTKLPFGFDAGAEMEADAKKIRFYMEGQTGIGIAGISFGPVFQLNRDEEDPRLGIQASCWINYIIGVDYRFRSLYDEENGSVGLYMKAPFATSGLSPANNGWGDWDEWVD